MTKQDKRLLVNQEAKLATLGVTPERRRGKLKRLTEQGVPYTNPRMLFALERFKKVDAQWKRLEAEI